MADIRPVLDLSNRKHSNIRYEKKPSDEVPTIAGYATAYPYHFHNISKGSPKSNDSTFYDTVFSSNPTFSPTNCRLRLSQFVILPPFQRSGHGGKFFDCIFKNARADPSVQEISVEDPSDAFEDLRDRRDLMFLDGEGIFKGIKAPVPKQWVEETRKKYKMPPVTLPTCDIAKKISDNLEGSWRWRCYGRLILMKSLKNIRIGGCKLSRGFTITILYLPK